MKALIAGDLHITNKCPENRMDDYENTVLNKFSFILYEAEKNNCDCVLQPGDFSDSPNLSYDFFVKVLSILKKSEMPIFTCWGQHDLRYRARENTFLSALVEACPFIQIPDNSSCLNFLGTDIYSSSFGEEIPKVSNCNNFNILLTHRMIIDEKLWEGQTDFQYANSFLRTNKFDLIVSGDNHKTFYYKIKDRHLFNLGALLRSTIGQIEHKPISVIFDTKTRSFSWLPIEIVPAEKVFTMEKIERNREINKELTSFISSLSEQKEIGLSFMDNLNEYAKINSIDQKVIEIIKECANG